MEKKKKAKYIGLAGALSVHLLVLLLLWLVGFSVPRPAEEGGMPVVLGQLPDAGGIPRPSLVDVDVMPQEETAPATPAQADEQPLLTQEVEESVAVPPKKQVEKKKEVKKETPKPTPAPKPEKSEAEKAEEARRKAAEEAARKQKAAEEAARNRVAGAFGKGAKMDGQGRSEGAGVQGSPEGNGTVGATTGVGGYGSFSLNGRSLGPGGLPRPAYNVQEEGRVVVTIVVNPAGEVVSTSINRQTNTMSAALRRAAEEAARKARFNTVSGLTNQTGTITYYFNLK